VTLTIDRLVTRGKIPRQLKVDSALIERVARDQFPAECGRQLSRPWPIQPPVARIRKLRVRLTIPAAELRPDTLAAAWTAAFIRELFATLAHPNGVEIVLFKSRAEYLAAAIRDLLNGVAAQRWAYTEFEHSFDLSTAEAAFAIFERDSSEIVPILLILDNWGLLDRLLAVWDQVALERFFFVIACGTGAQDKRPTIEDLITVAQVLLGRRSLLSETNLPRDADAHFVQGKLALKLFLGLARESDWQSARIASPQIISHALRILGALLDLNKSTLVAGWQLPTNAAGLQGDPIISELTASIGNMMAAAGSKNRDAFSELLAKLSSIASYRFGQDLLIEFSNIITTGSTESRTAFAGLFEQLVSVTGAGNSQDRTPGSKWISTDCAGLFFLVRIIDNLRWETRLARSSLGTTFGPRLLTYILAGAALAIGDRFDEEPGYLDSGLALFSGWFDGPDLRGLRDFFASGSVDGRRDVLRELLGQEFTGECSIDWLNCFDSLATLLIREFTEHIRCFGKPSRSFVVKNFLALPGRIRIEEKRLVVMFSSSPLHVVLHLSGLDDPVEPVGWLGARRIEFQNDAY
jgi:hypothetical protein